MTTLILGLLIVVLIAYIMHSRINYSNDVFDPVYYGNKYSILTTVYGTDPIKLAAHWAVTGLGEGRSPCVNYDHDAYLATLSAVDAPIVKAQGNAYTYWHYLANKVFAKQLI